MTTKQILLTLTLLLSSFSAYAGARQSSTSLLEAFRTCVALPSNTLAHDLMRSAWDEDAKTRFLAQHPEARAVSVTPDKADPSIVSATATLKDAPTIAGLQPKSVSAWTCEGGCGLALWALNFGPLNDKEFRRLEAWTQRVPASKMMDLPDVRVEALKQPDGGTSLVCSLSD